MENELIKMIQIQDKRNQLLDEIIERAIKREGQHIMEITTDIKILCAKLEKTIIGIID
ncbi:hypothetical protein P4V41_07550 [Fictibacillus nanhaiensis]|uniref:hypothetical protein n=1 Tax=Fictibacillus nanhaiensis TaxID=742169 RepID=UPI002E21B5BD|nr:hypothetical protein [Fictibacillus nanhaiensis]